MSGREHHRDRGQRRTSAVIVTVKTAEVARSSPALEVIDEHRDERRRQHAAEEQLVDDVRRRVREVVGVGERRLPERVREHRDAHEPGHA